VFSGTCPQPVKVLSKSATFLDFRLSQGSVATHCTWGGNLCDVRIENFLTNHLVKDFEIGLHLPKLIIIKHQVSYTFLEHGGFFVPNVMAIFWRGLDPLMRVSTVECRWSRQKFRFSDMAIGTNWTMTAGRANNCDDPQCNLPHKPPRVSESCLLHHAAYDDHDEDRRREQDLIVCSVNLKRK